MRVAHRAHVRSSHAAPAEETHASTWSPSFSRSRSMTKLHPRAHCRSPHCFARVSQALVHAASGPGGAAARQPRARTTPAAAMACRVKAATPDLMNPNGSAPRVIIRHCDAYDVDRIRAIVRDGLRELGLVPKGRTLVKPNLVAAGEQFPHAFTRPEF